jgi:osmoprotectant transport system ATP-binding protein
MIRFDDVTKEYPGGSVAVDGLSLTIPTGEITVLVGPSGCGKTTSLRMINRMIEPTRGLISIDGKGVTDMDAATLRRGIGYVIQHAGLFPHRTVLENVATVPRLLGWDRSKSHAAARDWLDRVGLSSEFADRYPSQLSGGQQQRVGVARALAADPPILLMDEPFSAVDPVVRQQLQAELLRLQADLQKTIVFVTHDIDEALLLGNRVAVMRVGGKLAQVDTPADLLANPSDDFVAGFLGRDRGIRSLSFAGMPRLPLRPERTLALGETPEPDAPAWMLVLDDQRPIGWVETGALSGPVSRDDLNRSGTVAAINASPREVLDAALSSPTGRGVVVDESGEFSGTVRASDLVTLLEAEQSR